MWPRGLCWAVDAATHKKRRQPVGDLLSSSCDDADYFTAKPRARRASKKSSEIE